MKYWYLWLRAICAFALLYAGSQNPALALNCGQQGGRPCTVFERIPSCDKGLIESGGHCVAPAAPTPCGGQNQRACLITERLPSCEYGLVESAGRCILLTPCGGQSQRACMVTERLPSCDRDLVELGGKCLHPACGDPGRRACLVTERIPSCDTGLVERNGLCEAPYAASPPGKPVAGSRSGAGSAVFIQSRPAAPKLPTPVAPSPCPGGAMQTFVVHEACGNQPQVLWALKSITGCTYAQAVQGYPPQGTCRYVP